MSNLGGQVLLLQLPLSMTQMQVPDATKPLSLKERAAGIQHQGGGSTEEGIKIEWQPLGHPGARATGASLCPAVRTVSAVGLQGGPIIAPWVSADIDGFPDPDRLSVTSHEAC